MVSDMVSEIEECGDGAEALDAYHRCLPDWALMDIEMDRIDGIIATREILLSYPRARVVIVSKYDDDSGGGPQSRRLRICVEREPHGNPRAAD
jgi:DNA-binding NarL/FixJ family response regulator